MHGDLNDKRRVLKLVFAERFTYDRESFVGTAKMSVLYELFEHFQGNGYQGVEMVEIESTSENDRLYASTLRSLP